jgi:hypothetical protein
MVYLVYDSMKNNHHLKNHEHSSRRLSNVINEAKSGTINSHARVRTENQA